MDVTIPDKCEFQISNSDQVQLTTKTNGDRITISGVQFTPEQAASLSYLINNQKSLSIEIKEA